jgi:putative methionine-R-sulfoxide reductase with GAF domain
MAGIAITNNGQVRGVLYCDAKKADFFTDARREDIVHAMAGIAYFVGLRYS